MASQIPAPQPQPKQKSRLIRFELSSLDQSIRALDTSHFRWTPPAPIREVTAMSIIGGTIPAPVTNIDSAANASWNSFTFKIGTQRVNITLPPGLYTEQSLPAKLEEVLNSAATVAGSTNTFTVSTYPNTSRLMIQRTAGADPYGFLFGNGAYIDSIDKGSMTISRMGSPALLFGFLPASNEFDVDGTLIAPNAMDLGLLTNRVYLYLNYDSTQDLHAYTRGMGRPSPTAIIAIDELRDGRKHLNKESYNPIITASPIARINTLDVVFQDFFGNPVNFGGREVSLVLELKCTY